MRHWWLFFAYLFLVLLPLQTRYIFWRSEVGEGLSEFGTVSVYLVMLLGWAIMGVAVVFHSRLFGAHHQEIRGKRGFAGRAMAYAVPCALGVMFHGFLQTWLQGSPWQPVLAWGLMFSSATIAGIIAYIIVRERGFQSVLFALGIGLGISAVVGGVQVLWGYFPSSTLFGVAQRSAQQLGDAVVIFGGERRLRMYGTFPHPNIFGICLALWFSGLWVRLIHVSEAHRCGENGGKVQRFLGLFVVAMIVMGVGWWISRAAALAMVCATLGAILIRTQKKYFLALVIVLPCMVWGMQFIAPKLLGFRGDALEARSALERVTQIPLWQEVLRRNGPWGVGVYQYPHALEDVRGDTLPVWEYQPVHNVFLLIFAELGVWGLGWVIFCVWQAFRRSNFAYFITMPAFPLLCTLWTLMWFDHALWTSWGGMVYTAVLGGSILSTLDKGVPTLPKSFLEYS